MRYVPIGEQDDMGRLAAALYSLAIKADSPEWMKGAAREMCRDFHVKMTEEKPLDVR